MPMARSQDLLRSAVRGKALMVQYEQGLHFLQSAVAIQALHYASMVLYLTSEYIYLVS